MLQTNLPQKRRESPPKAFLYQMSAARRGYSQDASNIGEGQVLGMAAFQEVADASAAVIAIKSGRLEDLGTAQGQALQQQMDIRQALLVRRR